jgi:putative Mg2+ transporter-C (MgtC) family protein
MLTTGAAALLVSLSSVVVEQWAALLGAQRVDTDPLRSIGAVVTGIRFLGAGTILRRGPSGCVEGLTTAASLLLAAAVGICVAMSLWVAAVGTTALALVVLRAVGYVEHWLEKQSRACGHVLCPHRGACLPCVLQGYDVAPVRHDPVVSSTQW